MSYAVYQEKTKCKTDSMTKQDALTQIRSVQQKLSYETLSLMYGEVETNAHSSQQATH